MSHVSVLSVDMCSKITGIDIFIVPRISIYVTHTQHRHNTCRTQAQHRHNTGTHKEKKSNVYKFTAVSEKCIMYYNGR